MKTRIDNFYLLLKTEAEESLNRILNDKERDFLKWIAAKYNDSIR
ncbi:hypothetical protein [Aquibacillus albus]|uniref:Transcriptional regulator n=1 Tax=Aquibacillus albus TaxID=1168171 RepID=A0ABS2N5U8_9BACI|nr:hypothetical protein [Aquibacillus albus]MBM7573516.1 putative transcriptional regulator [Aquibacillus albus]